MGMGVAGSKIIAKFQVVYMYFPALKYNKAFKYQEVKITILVFAGPKLQPTKKVFKKNKTCVVALLMFHENRKTMIF